MNAVPLAAFDSLASSYDVQWTHTPAGMLQREAVWRHVDPLIERGSRVLDLGCGTGEDALHLAGLGTSVTAVDSSPQMVLRAREKGVDAQVLGVEEIGKLQGAYDLVLSNFGVLNCVGNLSHLRASLDEAMRPGSHLAICLMGRFCLWETAYYLACGKWRKAVRRWLGAATASLGLRIYYPMVSEVRQALAPAFELYKDVGIGICVPPSFVPSLASGFVRELGKIDRRYETSLLRTAADHRLLLFRRK
ncbi:MAG TPA: methyltransferase domain-containing protein [Bryobacteraceae bacterium]|nr:methyltransferase domain-containing protein [Bryobacteraceae bacterium]